MYEDEENCRTGKEQQICLHLCVPAGQCCSALAFTARVSPTVITPFSTSANVISFTEEECTIHCSTSPASAPLITDFIGVNKGFEGTIDPLQNYLTETSNLGSTAIKHLPSFTSSFVYRSYYAHARLFLVLNASILSSALTATLMCQSQSSSRGPVAMAMQRCTKL